MKCRHCLSELQLSFIDLGFAPPSNAYLTKNDLAKPQIFYPLRVKVCDQCWLVQTEDYAQADELFDSEYAYFSSASSTWLEHAKKYTDKMIEKFSLTEKSFVIEIASNDGYLLKNFMDKKIPCLGIEPTDSTAEAAEKIGIPVMRDFFGVKLAEQLAKKEMKADLIAGNNVYAHVPDINDFTHGLKIALKPSGIITLEFPHLIKLVENCQFDTIYHEHFSYLSLTTVDAIFHKNNLEIFDVEELTTHGGSLRIFAQHADSGSHQKTKILGEILESELAAGIKSEDYYEGFQNRANAIKNNLVDFLIKLKQEGKSVGAYGAAAKGNTLLNYAGIRADLMPWVVDRSQSKQSKYLPGCTIPIFDESHIRKKQPDYIIILPWNLRDEVISQLEYAREWGAKFVTIIPSLQIS